MYFFSAIWNKGALNLVQIEHHTLKNYAVTAPSNGAIWDETLGSKISTKA